MNSLNIYSSGLIHMSEITNKYSREMPKKDKKTLQSEMVDLFPKGMDIVVKVLKIADQGYSLTIDKENEINDQLLAQIEAYNKNN